MHANATYGLYLNRKYMRNPIKVVFVAYFNKLYCIGSSE